MDKLVQGSPFVSVLIDESTDVSTTENLIIYIKLLNYFNPDTHLLGNIHIPNGRAETVTQVLKDNLTSSNVDEKRIVGFGSDGESMMTGKNNGVTARLNRVNPFLIGIHCMAHQLALCTRQASTGIQFLSTFKETLTALYHYFEKSSLQTHQLREFQEIFQQPQLKLKEVYEIRWFAIYGALEALYRTWSFLLAYFESHDDAKAKAAGFEKILKKYKFIASTSLMMDVMPILTYLSLVFQKQHLDLSVVQPAVSSAVSQITVMMTSDRKHLKEITSQLPLEAEAKTLRCEVTFQGRSMKVTGQQVKHFRNIKTKCLENTLSNLELRFPSDASNIVSCLHVAILGMRGIRFVPDIAMHGNEQLEKLIEFYGKEKDGENEVYKPIIDGENATRRNCLSKHQNGNKNRYSTETLNILTSDVALEAMDRKQVTALVLLHLSKAFDSIDHMSLLKKLRAMGTSKEATQWFRSYLTGRSQSVRIGCKTSEPLLVSYGVPQGSILGPALFNIYINDLPSVPKVGSLECYVDDSQLYLPFPVRDATLAAEQLTEDLQNIAAWCCQNSLLINPDKTKVLVLGTPQMLTKIPDDLSITLLSKEITPSKSAKTWELQCTVI